MYTNAFSLAIDVDCEDTGLYTQANITKSRLYQLYDGRADSDLRSSLNLSFPVADYIGIPHPKCRVQNCFIFNSRGEDAALVPDSYIRMGAEPPAADPPEKYFLELQTGRTRDREEFTFGCETAKREDSNRTEVAIAHSLPFTIEIDADCSNASNYRSGNMPLLFFNFRTNSSYEGVIRANTLYTVLNIQDGYLRRPGNCRFRSCRLEKAGEAEPFARVKAKINDTHYWLETDTSKARPVSNFTVTCEAEDVPGSFTSKPFTMQVDINCSDVRIYSTY